MGGTGRSRVRPHLITGHGLHVRIDIYYKEHPVVTAGLNMKAAKAIFANSQGKGVGLQGDALYGNPTAKNRNGISFGTRNILPSLMACNYIQ